MTRLAAPDLLFHNRGDGSFEALAAEVGLGLGDCSYSNGAAWADVDDDGDLDLAVTALGGPAHHLFINDGGCFVDEAPARGFALTVERMHAGQSVTFGDYDLDGQLDAHINESMSCGGAGRRAANKWCCTRSRRVNGCWSSSREHERPGLLALVRGLVHAARMCPLSVEVHPRVHRAQWAIARFGGLATRSFAALERCDPPADALVEYLAEHDALAGSFDLALAWSGACSGEPQAGPVEALFDSVRDTPAWVDWGRVERARRLFERTGMFGGLVLSLRALMGGYVAPAGNKPLSFSGRLREQAPRRVAETARFVTAVCAPSGMRPGAQGWLITLHVRLMHAQVRRLLWISGRWDHARWAAPINQHDMLATMLLFSEVYVEGLRLLGFDVSEEEAEDWVHLWRFVGWVMGTEAELLPRDYAEAAALRELIQRTQGPPDADSRALAAALLGTPPELPGGPAGQLVRLRLGMTRELSRMLIGDEVADQLSIDRAPVWSMLLPVVPRVVGAGEWVRARVPGIEGPLRRAGARYWGWVVEMSLRGGPARFARPDKLAGVR